MNRYLVATWIVVPTLALACAGSVYADSVQRAQATRTPIAYTLASVPTATGEIRFERYADGTVTIVERAVGGASQLDALAQVARSKGVSLCPAQVFGLLTDTAAPAELDRGCGKDAALAASEVEGVRAAAKAFRIFDDFRDRPLLCNGASDDAQFRDIECTAEQADLYFDDFYDADSTFWCANTLRTSSDRSMYSLLGSEGEAASTRVVSCEGNTRFRFYKRDSTGDSWILYRDYVLTANEYISFYSYDSDAFDDSDFRFRIDGQGGRHRSTGYFTDD
jgi:hypothetical protein